MFDFGFSELIVIGVVMLVVVGPERLPKVARTAGHLLGRVQRYVSDVKSDIQREMQLDELKKLQEQVKQQAQELESSVRAGAAGVESEVNRTADEVRSMMPDAPASAASAVAASQLLGQTASATAAPADTQLELGLDAAAGQAAAVSAADKTKA
ncbi:MAG: sec-independent protein translocase protein TatB [Thauera sp.]|nr:Sec-independent protein translocase protein TatB [Thauera sp.]MDI3490188.1 sec-independent protein translocase protein TatB [Thauera sp.]